MPEHDDLDRLLDSALSTYATPPSGLEERVLRSLSSERSIADARHRSRKMRRWLAWAIAVPACACLLIGLVMLLHTRQPATSTVQRAGSAPVNPVSRQPQGTVAAAAPPVTRRERTHSVRRTSFASVPAMPKREVFPTPQPLTPAEQALVTYIATAPEKDRRSLLEGQIQPNKPIKISAIEIAPITAPDHPGIKENHE